MIPTGPGGGGAAAGRYRFGEVVVDEAAHTLLRAGALQPLEPKAFAVLLALLQRPSELIGRDDLLDQVWGHRHVTPGVLTRAIAQLRHALDDDSQQPRYIQTQHALGYRFIGVLETDAPPAGNSVAAQGEDSVIGEPMELALRSAVDAVEAPILPRAPRDAQRRFDVAAADGVTADARQRSRGRPLWHWTATAMLTAAVAAAVWLTNRQPPRQRPDASIAVLPFVTLSDDSSDRYFAEGLAVEMSDALSGVQGLKVAAQMSPVATGRGDADVKALGNRLGVATVLDASVRRAGPRVRINARLSDTSTGYTLWSRTYDRELSDVFATQREIANEVVRSLLGVLPGSREALDKRLTPTRSIAAFDAYLKGLQKLRSSNADGDAKQAIAFFGQALEADRGFARAQAGICRSEVSRFENRNADAYERARAACQRAQEMDPGLSEVNLALAELYQVRGDLGKATEYYTRAEADPARRPAVYVGMAQVHAAQGREARALEYFKRALALRPGDGSIHAQIGYYHYLGGRLPEAIASYRKAIELQPGDAELWSMLGVLYLTTGDNAAATRALNRSIAIKPGYTALNNLGDLKYQAGQHAVAADLYRRATALEPADFLPWGNLGDALLADPANATQARTAFLEAATRAQRYVEIKSSDAKALAALGWYRANLGQAPQAREMIRRSEVLGGEPAEVALLNAQTLAKLGDIDQVRQHIAAARAAGIAENRITTNPVLRRANAVPAQAQPGRDRSPALGGSQGQPPGG